MVAQLVLLIILIACSFLVSGSETALFALSARQLRSFAQSDNPLRRRAYRLMRHPQRVLMTVLLANTTVNVAIFAVSFAGAARENADPVVAAITGIVALVLVVLLGEVIPKAVALTHAGRMAPLVAPVIGMLELVTTPIRVVLRVLLVEPATRVLSPLDPRDPDASLDDLRALVDMSARQGVISSRENDMLQAVFVLPTILVRSVMVPRVTVQSVTLNAPRSRILAVFEQTRRKQLPVIGRDMDDIRGMLRLRDLYLNPREPIERLIQPVRFVPEMINLLQLIHHFRQTASRLAIVVDEYGGVSGLITLEDVVEQIVGDLDSPDHPEEHAPIQQVDATSYLVSGRLGVRHWRKALGSLPELADVDTVGGVVAALLGRLPQVGDEVHVGNLSLKVTGMEGRRIDRVLLRLRRTAAARGRDES